MRSILKSFLPWVLFFSLIGHSDSSVETATIVALVTHVFSNRQTIKKGFVLDLGALIFFLLFALNVFIVKYAVITEHGYLISNCALAAIAWISLIVQRPFTLQYAVSQVALEVTKSPLFIIINYILTTVWAILLTLMALPNLLEIYHPIRYATDINLGVTILLILAGVFVTNKFPNWFSEKIINKKFNFSIKNLYKQQKSPDKPYEEFNTAAISQRVNQTTQVIIVGSGPIGLTSALLLQQHGIEVIILEKHPAISFHPKARHISCRSMEIFRKLGIEDEIKKRNLPEKQSWFGWFSQLTGPLHARISKQLEYPAFSPSDEANVAQPYLEQALLEKFIQNGGAVYFDHVVTDFSQNTDMVQVVATNRNTKETLVFQGAYLLAADGAHSTIRELLQIPMIGPDEVSTLFSVYCEIDLKQVIEKHGLFSMAFIVQPNKPAPMVLSVDGKNKWIFIFPSAGVSTKHLKEIYTDAYIKEQISEVIGIDSFPINILSKNAWSLGAQIANQLRANRVFLVGDAAHRFPPSGGMGMNSGLQDVDNLMWKLASVIKKETSTNILDTYSQERVPAILNTMDWSVDNLKRIVRIQRQIERKSMRDVDFQAQVQTQEAHLNKSGLDLGAIYTSSMVAKSNEKKPDILTDRYIPNTCPGARMPHFGLIRNNVVISSLDLISTDFVLLFEDQDTDLAHSINFKSLPTEFIPIGNVSDLKEAKIGEFKNTLGLNKSGALWVRPDGHIAWKGCLDNPVDMRYLMNLIDQVSR